MSHKEICKSCQGEKWTKANDLLYEKEYIVCPVLCIYSEYCVNFGFKFIDKLVADYIPCNTCLEKKECIEVSGYVKEVEQMYKGIKEEHGEDILKHLLGTNLRKQSEIYLKTVPLFIFSEQLHVLRPCPYHLEHIMENQSDVE